MLNNLLFSLNVVLPIFIMIIVGLVIAKLGYLDDNTIKRMNDVIFKFAMPVMLFREVLEANLSEVLDPPFVIYAVITTFLSFFGALALALIVTKDRKKVGAFVQGAFRGNYVFIGIPVITNIMGGSLPGRAHAVITFIVPLYNILSVIILTLYGSSKESFSKTLLKTLKNIATNPLIWGVVSGIVANLLNFSLVFEINGVQVTSLEQFAIFMRNMATPVMLLCIGATLDFSKLKTSFKHAMYVSIYKLVLVPLVFLSFAMHYLGFEADAIVVLYVMYAAPTAIASYTMAVAMNSDENLASSIVVLTSVLSIITFTVGVYLLRSLGIV